MDGYARTILKTLSWRAIATITTMVIVYLYTREMALSLGVGIFEVTSKLALYYFHERAWQRVPWGRTAKEDVQKGDSFVTGQKGSALDRNTMNCQRLPMDVASD